MYIVTIISDVSVDSSLCINSESLTQALNTWAIIEDTKRSSTDHRVTLLENVERLVSDCSIDFPSAVVHIQGLNAYSRQQLSLINQQTPLAPQEPLKPFVVAATLPDNTEVVLRRFDNEADQKMFESNCYISHWQECKCGVCGKVLGDESDVFVDHYSPALLCVNHSRFNDSIEAYEATEGDLEYRKRTVKVVLEDDDSYETPIYGTKKIVEDYFAIGSTLNMGVAEDRMVAIKELIFLS